MDETTGPIMILDFDGTVCIGDGPVRRYAEAAVAHLGRPDADAVRDGLDRFLAGDPDSPRYRDGYHAVTELTSELLPEHQRQDAFLTSRGVLANGTVFDISAPQGLPEFLAAAGRQVQRHLITNSPLNGVIETLERLGIAHLIDRIDHDAAKPEGLHRLLHTLTSGSSSGRDAESILSVGDVYENDIAPARCFGAITAYIDRFNHNTGPAHMRAAGFPDLYEDILAWADDPGSFLASHPIAKDRR